jgi:hypothetical protein
VRGESLYKKKQQLISTDLWGIPRTAMNEQLEYVSRYSAESQGSTYLCTYHPLSVGGQGDVKVLAERLRQKEKKLKDLEIGYQQLRRIVQKFGERVGLDADRILEAK